MSLKTLMLILVCAMALTTGTAVGAPVIEDFSSTGGLTRNKTGPQDTIYLAKPGDKITFTVKTDGVEKYEWQVNNKAQDNPPRKSFSWTVPAEKSNWDITASVSSLAGRNRVTWSITTNTIKTVKPGQSIQKAIDSLPAEGGIVELLAGTWDLAEPIRIVNRGNITIWRAGIDNTHLRTNRKMVMILVTPFEDNAWVLDEANGGRAAQRLGRDPKLEADYVDNISLADFHLTGDGVPVVSPVFQRGGILLGKVSNSRIVNVCMEKTGTGMNALKRKGLAIVRCRWKESDFGGLILQHSTDNLFENCRFESGERWYALDLNSDCHRNKIIGNTFKGYVSGDVKIYSWSHHNEVIGNMFDGSGSSRGGVIIMNSSWDMIEGNIFKNHDSNRRGHWATVVQRSGGGSHPPEHYLHDNKISNNVFYATHAGDSVKCVAGVPPEVRNNIIVESRGNAIVGIPADKCSHNNLWKNAGGNTGGGTGSITADPLFADAAGGDFHLKSNTGRWDAKTKTWVTDKVTSPGIDGGGSTGKIPERTRSQWRPDQHRGLWKHDRSLQKCGRPGCEEASSQIVLSKYQSERNLPC